MSVDEWLAALGTLPLAYQPGERFHYGHSTRCARLPDRQGRGKAISPGLCRSGYSRLSAWRIRTSGSRMEKRGRLASLYRYDEAAAADWRKCSIEMYDAPPAYTPGGGGLISSAADYHRFARMLLGEGAA